MTMNYNHFTIRYIEAIQRNLSINLDHVGEASLIHSNVNSENLQSLKNDLNSIWIDSSSAIEVIKNKYDSKIQSGLFGLVDDLDLALKTGFLMGDRVVLLDYLFDRALRNTINPNIDHIASVANALVRLLPLAKKGRVVIIPNPFSWHHTTKAIIREVSDKALITIPLLSMLNMLSICKLCNLHPYTIAESESEYRNIIDHQIDHVDAIGRDGAIYSYEGILCSLLSERLINEEEFSFIKNIPIESYSSVIAQHKGFYSEYMSHMTSGGSLNSDNNINELRNLLHKANDSRSIESVAKDLTTVSGIAGAGLAAASMMTTMSSSLLMGSGLLVLAGSFGSVFSKKSNEKNTVISLFKKLSKES